MSDEIENREEPSDASDRHERFMRLFLQHERRIYGFILTLVPNWTDADDLLQETSAVMWRKFETYRTEADFAAWGISIARFRAKDYWRKRGTELAAFPDETIDQLAEETIALQRQDNERNDALDSCLGKLAEEDRQLVRMRYEGEYQVRELACFVGKSTDAVYKTLNRIHLRLQQCVRATLARESST